jgi:hypothetical protein
VRTVVPVDGANAVDDCETHVWTGDGLCPSCLDKLRRIVDVFADLGLEFEIGHARGDPDQVAQILGAVQPALKHIDDV